MKNILDYDPKTHIIIKGAHLHNLKNVDIAIPRNKLTVITGLSGSGKSSLAFDTLYAEGQRRYVESLSSYARQFMGRLNKPKVDFIKGLSPAIAVEQKVNTSNPRSTVGTKTEIYDYLKLLFARIGKTYSPISNKEVKKDSVTDIINLLKSTKEGDKLLLLAPIKEEPNRTLAEKLKIFIQQGFARIHYKEEVFPIDTLKQLPTKGFDLVIDRLIIRHEEDFYNRVSDAIEIGFYEGKGYCSLLNISDKKRHDFSNKFEMDDIIFSQPSVHLFSFNNPVGACSACEGFGDIIGIDPELVISDTSLSIYDDAIIPWRGTGMRKFHNNLINNAYRFDFPIHKPYFELSEEQIEVLWKGNSYFTGITPFFKKIEAKIYKIQNRVLLSRYRGKTKCFQCGGSRLKDEILLPEAEINSDPSWFGFPITLKKDSKFKRTDIVTELTKNKIGTRLLFAGNLTKQPAYLNKNFRIHGNLEVTDLIMNNTFWVGIQPAIGQEELSFVAKVIKAFFKK